MRCETCSKIHFRDLENGAVHLHPSLTALQASAAQGCDLCTLCWAVCEPAMSRFRDTIAEAEDRSVWLEGNLFPNHDYRLATIYADPRTPPTAVQIYLGAFMRPDDGEVNRKRVGLGELHVFAEADTPASLLFTGRLTAHPKTPKGYIPFTQHALKNCRTHHSCTPHTPSYTPTRLIALHPTPHLLLHPPLVPYIALSYTWGPHPFPCLTTHTLLPYQSHLPPSLPKTYTDAFTLAHDLGYTHIWIDALCIIQGDTDDWTRESALMQSVFSNAALTLIAGRSSSVFDGFLSLSPLSPSPSNPPPSPPKPPPCALPFSHSSLKTLSPQSEMGNIHLHLPRSHEDGPVSTRGWCLQEAVLSPRTLVFAQEQIYFQCRELRIWEDGYLVRSPIYEREGSHNTTYSVLTTERHKEQGKTEEDRRRRMLIYWYKEILWHYTERQITNPADVFAAVSGLAQAAQAQIRSRYLAGLWEVDMVRGLLWQPRHVYLKGARWLTGCQRRVLPVEEVPSWSWAAVEGQVGIDYLIRHESKYHASNALIRPKYEHRWTDDSICHASSVHVASCELQLFGRLRQVKALQYLKGRPAVLNRQREQYYEARVKLVPMHDGEATQDLSDGDEHIVATGFFDVAKERVDVCWCMPITTEEGIIVIRNEHGKFRRAGSMQIVDLAWLTSGEEEEIRLV